VDQGLVWIDVEVEMAGFAGKENLFPEQSCVVRAVLEFDTVVEEIKAYILNTLERRLNTTITKKFIFSYFSQATQQDVILPDDAILFPHYICGEVCRSFLFISFKKFFDRENFLHKDLQSNLSLFFISIEILQVTNLTTSTSI
jgi:hypothetical protein